MWSGKKLAHTSSACKIFWHSDSDVEVLCLGLRKSVAARNIIGDGQVLGDDTMIPALPKTVVRL